MRGIGGCRLGRTPPVLVHLCWTGRRLQVISELVLLQLPQQIKTCSQPHGGVGEGSGLISCHCRQESRADNQQLCEGPIHRRLGVLLGKWEDSAACESMSSSSSRIWSFSLQPGQFIFGYHPVQSEWRHRYRNVKSCSKNHRPKETGHTASHGDDSIDRYSVGLFCAVNSPTSTETSLSAHLNKLFIIFPLQATLQLLQFSTLLIN